MRKRISDLIDRNLSDGDRAGLEAHLRECAPCRSYRELLEKIQAHSAAGRHPRRAPEYWQNSLLKLNAALKAGRSGEPIKQRLGAVPIFPRRRWAWAGATAIVLAVCGLYILFSRGPAPQDIIALSFEGTLNRIDQELGANPELETAFNSAIKESIFEHLKQTDEPANPFHYENPLFIESLNDEDLELLDAALGKELKF